MINIYINSLNSSTCEIPATRPGVRADANIGVDTGARPRAEAYGVGILEIGGIRPGNAEANRTRHLIASFQ